MSLLNATFDIPGWLDKGLKTGEYIRYGGEVRNQGGQIVALLRDAAPNAIKALPDLTQINTVIGGVNLGVSVLSLGVSVMGFILVSKQLKELEQRLTQMQELMQKINYKVDLAFYANFLAAVDLATNAFTMSNPDNRRSSALQAINRFIEAEHIYTNQVDQELERNNQIANEYLLTLALAYVCEARCYLELGEYDTAIRRFQEGETVLRSRIKRYIAFALTSNPSAYLQPELKGKVNLAQITKIYQWADPALNENAVFELHRRSFVEFVENSNKWFRSLPKSISANFRSKQEVISYLPNLLRQAESMIETNYRFQAYQTEVKAIAQLGISFHDWLQLAPKEAQPEGSNLMYIIPAEPLAL